MALLLHSPGGSRALPAQHPKGSSSPFLSVLDLTPLTPQSLVQCHHLPGFSNTLNPNPSPSHHRGSLTVLHVIHGFEGVLERCESLFCVCGLCKTLNFRTNL